MDEGLYKAAERLVGILQKHGKTISTAESCTGGLISAAITAIPGASNIFSLGVCTYSAEQKINILGVSPEVIKKYTVVSSETVLQMAGGIKKLALSDYAISVSGIAGPGGGTAGNPVGTVWFGFAAGEKILSEKRHFKGNRDEVRKQAVLLAIEKIIEIINGEKYDTP